MSDVQLGTLTNTFNQCPFQESLFLSHQDRQTSILLFFSCQRRIFYINVHGAPATILATHRLLALIIYSQSLLTRKDFKQFSVSPLLQITLLWGALSHPSELFVLSSPEPHDCGDTARQPQPQLSLLVADREDLWNKTHKDGNKIREAARWKQVIPRAHL